MKAAGLPAGEKTRITAFENSAYSNYLNLRAVKDYRTSVGLRAYARMYILVTPIAFGPYYALVAQDTNIYWAVALSIITSSAMQGLYNLRRQLEGNIHIGINCHMLVLKWWCFWL